MIETIIIFDYVGGGIDVNIVIITLFESFSLSAENVSRSFSHGDELRQFGNFFM